MESLERYQELKQSFSQIAKLLKESEVNGRPISTFKLTKPIVYGAFWIDILELPAPKAGKSVDEGFEHIEIVCDTTFSDLQKRFPQLKYDVSGLKKTFNQELEVCLGKRNLKFHHVSLESVVRLESQTQVWKALETSQVLQILNEYQPLVAGTFPLGLENENSDIDVLVGVENLEELSFKAIQHWGHLDSFRTYTQDVDGLETLIIQFLIDYVPFEIFAQNRASIYQTGYRHFLIEERLLKYCSEPTRKALFSLRAAGVKTEPAFAEAFGIQGNPYQELLSLQRATSKSLIEMGISK